MLNHEETPVKKITEKSNSFEVLDYAIKNAENKITREICSALNILENVTGFEVSCIRVNISDDLESTIMGRDREVDVKIFMDTSYFSGKNNE